jgi:hypothetical protein
METLYEKNEMRALDDSASDTLKSVSRSIDEKTAEAEAEESVRRGYSSPAPAALATDDELTKKTTATSIAKEAQAELTKIITSAEGVEYPTGVKLGLISLALCLSVFLMALVRGALLFSFSSC